MVTVAYAIRDRVAQVKTFMNPPKLDKEIVNKGSLKKYGIFNIPSLPEDVNN